MGWTEGFWNLLYPPHCPQCGAYVPERGDWCQTCLPQVLRVQRLPLDSEMFRMLRGAWAVGRYRGGLRNLVRSLKYQGKRDRLPYLQALLHAAEPELEFLRERPLLAVPVPLYPAKEKQRGFNQAELIFRDWLAALGIPMERVLSRIRDTSPQYGLGAKERAENMKGAFAIVPGAEISDREILLVDDIFTTGSTLHECGKVLRAYGAQCVYALVMASDHG